MKENRSVRSTGRQLKLAIVSASTFVVSSVWRAHRRDHINCNIAGYKDLTCKILGTLPILCGERQKGLTGEILCLRRCEEDDLFVATNEE